MIRFLFHLGCGGYILSQGNITVPQPPESECVWYIENPDKDHTLLLAHRNEAQTFPYSMIVIIIHPRDKLGT